MQVRAKREGYYGLKRRKPNTVFNLKDPKHFSSKWMEKVGGSTKKKTDEVEVIESEAPQAEESINDDVI